MTDSTLRRLRQASGLTQAELAGRAGVSRQLVGAIEAGRHLPRVDAALSLAAALSVPVEKLFGRVGGPVEALSGEPAAPGAMVRLGRVGDLMVTAPARVETEGWDPADGVVEPDGRVSPAGGPFREGIVIAGCEPGMVLLERILRSRGMGAVAVAASSTSALVALEEGRLHAAVVHGSEGGLPPPPDTRPVARLHLARWRVGLAGPRGNGDWVQPAMEGYLAVAQREEGAGVQHAFEEAVGPGRLPISGPLVASHLEAARHAATTGMPAITIEPAAMAVGTGFHPLAVHVAEIWIGAEWVGSPVIDSALGVIADAGFQRRLAGVGGYDLTDIGSAAA